MDIEALERQAKWAKNLNWAYFVVILIGAVSQYFEINLLQRIANGTFASQEVMMAEANANDLRQQAVAIVYLVAFAVAGIASLMWTYRAAANAKYLEDAPMRISPGMAVGWYFVPIASLWMPFRSMKEIAQRSSMSGDAPAGLNLGWWWFLWIATAFGGNVLLRMVLSADDVNSIMAAGWMSLVVDVATLPLVFIYVRLIEGITQMQAFKAANPVPPLAQPPSDTELLVP